jgi:hypothetical protein
MYRYEFDDFVGRGSVDEEEENESGATGIKRQERNDELE